MYIKTPNTYTHITTPNWILINYYNIGSHPLRNRYDIWILNCIPRSRYHFPINKTAICPENLFLLQSETIMAYINK